jgi:hypothetical protein
MVVGGTPLTQLRDRAVSIRTMRVRLISPRSWRSHRGVHQNVATGREFRNAMGDNWFTQTGQSLQMPLALLRHIILWHCVVQAVRGRGSQR